MTITAWMAALRRERRVLRRVSRAAWRLEQAERERAWALASARAEGLSIRKLAAAAGLSPARVHQITAAADLDELDAALGELRAAGWPAPEDPGGDDDAELDGRDLICDRLLDEAGWIRQCAGWLTHLHTDSAFRAPCPVRNIPGRSPAVVMGTQARGPAAAPDHAACSRFCRWRAGGDRHGRAHDRCRGLSNNGTVSGGSGLRVTGLPDTGRRTRVFGRAARRVDRLRRRGQVRLIQ